MPPQDSCVSTNMTLRCPNYYVVIITKALYGVTQTSNSCQYSHDDCLVDTMNTILCPNDVHECVIYAAQEPLIHCNNQSSNYLHIEYDCVPLWMNDPGDEYNMCENDNIITNNHGRITSPGYSHYFQTTETECSRTILVPNDKILRLWLTDLYIGTAGIDCSKDYVAVVDRHDIRWQCGLKRYSYPLLYSSTVMIRYFASTKSVMYRGMRMYFEIIDRSSDNTYRSSNGTTTMTSTVQSFQLCKVVRKNIYGVTHSNQCEDYNITQHCLLTTEPTFSCRQRCTYLYTGNRAIPSCENRIATYLYVKYHCMPINTELVLPNISCPIDNSKMLLEINRQGRFQSYDYPNLKNMNCTYRLRTKPGHIMHIYAIDISLNDFFSNCTQNKLSLIEDGEIDGSDFCEERSQKLIYSTRSNEIDLHYIVTDDRLFTSHGVHLYIESQPDASMTVREKREHDLCFNSSLNYSCPIGYTFMITSAFYGIMNKIFNQCRFMPGDCIEDTLSTINQCQNDQSTCFLSYMTKRRLSSCSDKYGDYLHVMSECVPSKPHEVMSSLKVYNICETNDTISDINGIIISPGFPSYERTNGECRRSLVIARKDQVLKIWLNEIDLSSDNTSHNTCSKDYLMINTAYVYCGIHKLAMTPISASKIDIQYRGTTSSTSFYKGFKLYFEWIEKSTNMTYNDTTLLSTTTSFNIPIPLWAQNLELSPILSAHICFGSSYTLQCPRQSDYVLSIIYTSYGVSGTGLCKVPEPNHCQQQVSLNLTCTYSCLIEYYTPQTIAQCTFQNADYITIDYECIPTRLPKDKNPIDICAPYSSNDTFNTSTDVMMMISPNYPTLNSTHNCSKRIETLPGKLWMIYLVDLSLEGRNDLNTCNITSLTTYDGHDEIIQCGLKQLTLMHVSCSHFIEFKFVSNSQAFNYRGFEVFLYTINAPNDWSYQLTNLMDHGSTNKNNARYNRTSNDRF
ncbi:hypothetical protein I4U23_015216 [Adineta vaga]|nr:hypothetical protein I4U23_015216 [Adineta vaga]